jgi:hypothetical protein
MLKRVISIVLLVALLMASVFTGNLVIVNAAGNTYYVSATGNDTTGDGSLLNPWSTIQKAADIMTAGDICEIRGGTYREMVVPANSGTDGSKITFRAYGAEKVVISGTEPVTGWTQDAGNIYKAPMDWSLDAGNQVFVNGTMLYAARWPNNTGTLMAQTYATTQAGTHTTIQDSAIPDGLDPVGCGLWYRGGAEWMATDKTISAYDAASKTLTFYSDGSSNENYDPMSGTKYFLFGSKQLLDAENEFWYDQNQLYLCSPDAASLQGSTVEAKKRKYGIDLSGKSNIEIIGLELFATSLKTDDNTSGVLIKNVKATYVANSVKNNGGIPVDEDNGILIRGTNNEINSCEIAYSSAALLNVYGSHSKVVNCYIHDGDYAATWSGLVSAKGTYQYIGYNTICNAIRETLLIRLLQKSIVEHNDIYNSGMGTSDNGLIYACNTDGMGTEIRYNKVHDSFAPASDHGIYLDNQCSHFIVHHNVIWDVPKDDALHLNYPSEFNLIYNNTVATDGNLSGMGYFYDYYYVRIFNNIFGGNVNHPQTVARGNNITGGTDPKYVDAANHDYRIAVDSPAVDMGSVIPGITDGYSGNAPDIGAYEYGQEDFKTGHDFNNPPVINLNPVDTIYSDKVVNGSFEAGSTASWDVAAGTKAEMFYDEMGAWDLWTAANERTQDYSLKLSGNSTDWNTVTPLASAEVQQAVSLKVTEDDTYYYFCIQGSNFTSGIFGIFLNADNDSTTGYGSSGSDYMISATHNYVATYKYTGADHKWGWTGAGGDSAYSENLNAIEIRVSKSNFGTPDLSPSFGVKAEYDNSDYDFVCGLPADGSFASYTQNAAAAADITLDGATADWADVTVIADVPVQKAVSLKVTDDSNYIDFHVEGNNLEPNYQILMNTDNNASTGFMASTWTESGFDYRIENGSLYSHPSNDSDGDVWVRIENVDVSGNAAQTVIDAKVAKSALNLNGNTTIPVALYSKKADWTIDCALPASGDLPAYLLTGTAPTDASVGQISQSIQNLLPNTTYVLTGWAKSTSAESSVILGVKDYGGNAIEQEIKNTEWTGKTIEFTTGPTQTTATVYVIKSSPGDTYIDDISVGLPLGYATAYDRLLDKIIQARAILAKPETGLPQEIIDRFGQQIQTAAATSKNDNAAIESAMILLQNNMDEFVDRNTLYKTANQLQAVCSAAVEGGETGQYPVGARQQLQDVIDLANKALVNFDLVKADIENVITALTQQGDLFKMQVKAENFNGVARADMTAMLKDSANWLSAYTISGEENIFTVQNSKYTGQKYGNELFEFNMSYDFKKNNSEWPGIMLRSQSNSFLWNGDTTYFIIFKYDKWELQKWVAGVQDSSFFKTTPNTQFTGVLPTKITVGVLDVENGVRIVCYAGGQLVYDVVDTNNPITSPGYFGFETNAGTTMSPINVTTLKPITALTGSSVAEVGTGMEIDAGIYCIPESVSGSAGFKDVTIKYDSSVLSFAGAQAGNGTNPVFTTDASQSGTVRCIFNTGDTTNLKLKFNTLSVSPLSLISIEQCTLQDGAGNAMSTAQWLKLLQVNKATPKPKILFSDSFSGRDLGPSWKTAGGIWLVHKGVLSQVSVSEKDTKKAIVSRSKEIFPDEVTITAKVRVDNWKDGDAARAGVSLFTNTKDGCGYNLVFHNNHNTVQFLDDKVVWGPSFNFKWKNNTWYWFKLKMEGGVLYGKVWKDGDAEPIEWPYSWERSGRTGYPALNGGAVNVDFGKKGISIKGLSTVSFDDVAVTGIPAVEAKP